MILEDFKPFVGQHCETTATGSLLKQIGVDLSEPLLFGLGEGLGFIYWKMKTMPFPFLGGRTKADLLTENLCRNLNLDLEVKETSSLKKAWGNVTQQLAQGQAVGLKLDMYHLDYFSSKQHFAAHYVALYGYDDEYAYLVDTAQQGTQARTTLENLALARNEKGPMSSQNRSYTIIKNGPLPPLEVVIPKAIHRNANEYLNPPIGNFGYKGILKTSTEMPKEFKKSTDVKSDFKLLPLLMERAGTGGSLFRNLYRDFLKEAYALTGIEALQAGYEAFVEIAGQWKQVAQLYDQAGETEEIQYVKQASEILVDLSASEKKAMEQLQTACAKL